MGNHGMRGVNEKKDFNMDAAYNDRLAAGCLWRQ